MLYQYRILKATVITKYSAECCAALASGGTDTFAIVWPLSLPTAMNCILKIVDKVSGSINMNMNVK